MPEKLGNGGHSLENYDPNTGKYKTDGVPNKYYDNPDEKLSQNQKVFFKNSKARDDNGNLKTFYHGTRRKDRVGNYFDPSKATSGPMAFFTDNREIAESYAQNKQDTSIYYDDYDSYNDWFKLKDSNENISSLWDQLTPKEKTNMLQKASHITFDDDYENIIYDENAKNGLGNFNEAVNEHNGNVLEGLVQSFLTDGNLYGNEEKFMDVLKILGIDDKIEFDDPNKIESGVYDVYLNITNPFVVEDIDENFINELESIAPKFDENIPIDMGADMWDKKSIYRQSKFIENLRDDLKNGTSYAWTSIPDWTTNFLKEKGYDGIFDNGGKGGGSQHKVAIPFFSNQIKNIENLNPTYSNDITDEENNNKLKAQDLFGLKFN